MKNRTYLSLLFISLAIFLMGFQAHHAKARYQELLETGKQSIEIQPAAPTQTSASYPSITETPEPRKLPAFGGNAGLVIGASLLVLIIIGGVVFSSRKKAKH